MKTMQELRDDRNFRERSFELALAELKERGALAARTNPKRQALGFMDIIATQASGGALAVLIWEADPTLCIAELSDATALRDWLLGMNSFQIWCYQLNHQCSKWTGMIARGGFVEIVPSPGL